MVIMLSELYGKDIISNTGKRMGKVEDMILDFEDGKVSALLLMKVDNIIRSEKTSMQLKKNSVSYSRVRNVSETVIVSESEK